MLFKRRECKQAFFRCWIFSLARNDASIVLLASSAPLKAYTWGGRLFVVSCCQGDNLHTFEPISPYLVSWTKKSEENKKLRSTMEMLVFYRDLQKSTVLSGLALEILLS